MEILPLVRKGDKMTEEEYKEAHYFFLRLWTYHVGSEDYIKRIWRNIDNLMQEGYKSLKEKTNDTADESRH